MFPLCSLFRAARLEWLALLELWDAQDPSRLCQ